MAELDLRQAVADLRNTKRKNMAYWGSNNARVVVTLSETVKPVSVTMIKDVLGRVAGDFVKEEVKVSMTEPCKRLLAMVFQGNYTEGSLDELIQGISSDAKIQDTLRKKLKGRWAKDTAALMQVAGLDERQAGDCAYLAAEVIGWEWLCQVLKSAGWAGTVQETIEIVAYIHARKNKRFRREVLAFSANLEDNLHKIRNELVNQTYLPGRYHKRVIHEPAERLIMWQDFIHRVVQWAVYQIINPAFVNSYIEDSFACIPGRGTNAAAERLYQFMRQAGRRQQQTGFDAAGRPKLRFWVQKLDTSKFFYRIDHEVSMELIGKKCNYDPWLMWLMDLFVNAPGERFGFPPGLGVNDLEPEEMLGDKGLARQPPGVFCRRQQ